MRKSIEEIGWRAFEDAFLNDTYFDQYLNERVRLRYNFGMVRKAGDKYCCRPGCQHSAHRQLICVEVHAGDIHRWNMLRIEWLLADDEYIS